MKIYICISIYRDRYTYIYVYTHIRVRHCGPILGVFWTLEFPISTSASVNV